MVIIRRSAHIDEVVAAEHLMDHPVASGAAARFLAERGHHLLLAYPASSERPIGMVSGVEMTHPDKGTEMFLYELSVEEPSRRQGVATALVHALAQLAQDRGCYGMWVLTDSDNPAALAAYRAAGGAPPTTHEMITWTFDRPQD